jgi:[acyl-carrier-protein] S-malonyltransferase
LSKQAFLFPGQGSQYVGMAEKILERVPGASRFLEEASDLLHMDLGRLIGKVPGEERCGPLFQDTGSQLAIFVANAIYWSVWRDRGPRPWAVTGYSLGFYSALMAAEVFDLSKGLTMVQEAGRMVGETFRLRPGKMAAVIGLSEREVLEICQEVQEKGFAGVANFNASNQMVISGDREAVKAACSLALARGALGAKEIRAQAAYHSPLMEVPSRQFAGFLEGIPLEDPRLPVLSYLDAQYVSTGQEAREVLSRHLKSQTRWGDCIERLVGEGVDTFIEVGPGQVLSRLTRWINRGVTCYATDDDEVLSRLLEGRGLD